MANKIYRMGEYVLKHKTFKKYYAGGRWGSEKLTSVPDRAIVFSGALLKDNAHLWERNFTAIKIGSGF